MNYRLIKFFSRANYVADTTVVIDINIQDVMSNISILYELVNADGTSCGHPAASITKVELVDGSDVLFSLDGAEIEALDWYNKGGRFPANYNYALAGGNIQRTLNLNFGRYLWDPELAFDPKQFNNPQLRISLDINGGGNSCVSMYLTCYANLFETQPAGLKGFLMAKEFKQWTMADNTHEYTDLPVDYPYRALYHRAALAGTESNQCVQNIKLSEDQDKRVPYNQAGNEIMRCVTNNYPFVEEAYFYAIADSSKALYITPSTLVTAQITQWNAAAKAMGVAAWDGDGGRLYVDAITATGNTQINVTGHIPHSVFEIPFGLKNDINNWYDVRNIGNLKADIEGAAAAQGYLFAQQFRNY